MANSELARPRSRLVRLRLRHKARIETLEAQLKVCMAAVANGRSVQVPTAPKGNAPRPPAFHGARNAREIDNFLWGLEAYFGAMGIEDDAQKLSNAAFSLNDIALIWWRRRCDDVRRGFDPINTWDEFKSELKKQFYPKDAEREARTKLRHLQHKEVTFVNM